MSTQVAGGQPAQTQSKKRRGAVQEAPSIPPELLLRRDKCIRYERGGIVYATDGRVGVLRRIVVDEENAEVMELGIEVDGSGSTVLLPPDLVDKTAGSAVFLTVNRVQFTERASGAALYDKAHFVAADLKALLNRVGKPAGLHPRRSVAQAGSDFVEAPTASPLDRLQRKPLGEAAD